MLYISILLIVLIGIWITFFGLSKVNEDVVSEVGVILGNKINNDGTPSERLKARLDHGLKLYNQNQIQKIIVSGDKGLTGYNEALVMSKYLTNSGIPEEDIIVDQHGNNTKNSINFINQYSQLTGTKSFTIISQHYHLKRSQLLSKKSNIQATISYSAPKYFEKRDIYSLARETIAYLYYLAIKSEKTKTNPPNYIFLSYLGTEYLVYKPKVDQLKFKYLDEHGEPYQRFNNLLEQNSNILFATNAGIYQEDSTPLGLYVEEGKTIHSINEVTDAYGNFYLQPNGIFSISNNKATINTTSEYIRTNPKSQFATQSGPMLVINNQINSLFQSESENKKIRSSVGVNNQGEVFMVLSEDRSSFFEIAKLHQEVLNTPNALYLDGGISQTYIQSLKNTPSNLIDYGGFIVETTNSDPKSHLQ